MNYKSRFVKSLIALLSLIVVCSSNAPDVSAGVDDGLIAYYPFNGNANDETGNGYDGTVHDATLTEDRFGNIKSAYAFDGSYDYIDIGTALDFPCQSTYAVSVWFLNTGGPPQTNGYGQKIMAKANFFNDFWLSVYTSGHSEPYTGMFYWQQYTGVGPAIKGIADTDYNYMDNQWHHVVVNRNGGYGELWLDGELKGTASTLTDVCNTQHLLIGYTDHDDYLQQLEGHWNGKIDDIRIYDRMLVQAEIEELYGLAEVAITKAKINFVNEANRDNYAIEGEVALRQDSNGIDPVNEDISVTVGTSTLVIPAGSFAVTRSGEYRFKGKINSTDIDMRIRPFNLQMFKFTIDTRGVDLTDTTNPVDVGLTLGDDIGKATTRLQGQLKMPGKSKQPR